MLALGASAPTLVRTGSASVARTLSHAATVST